MPDLSTQTNTPSTTTQDVLQAFTVLAQYALGIVELKTQTLNTLQATYDALHKSYEDLQVQFANAPTSASNAADKQKIAELQTSIDTANASLQDAKNQKDALAAADATEEAALLTQFNAFKDAITPPGVAPVAPIVAPTPGEVVPPIDTTPVLVSPVTPVTTVDNTIPVVNTPVTPATPFNPANPGNQVVTPTPVVNPTVNPQSPNPSTLFI